MDNYPLSRLDYSNDRKQTSLLIKTPIKFVNISSFLCSILLSSPIFPLFRHHVIVDMKMPPIVMKRLKLQVCVQSDHIPRQ